MFKANRPTRVSTAGRDFKINDEQVNDYGLPQITQEDKRWILFDNFQRRDGSRADSARLRNRVVAVHDAPEAREKLKRARTASA